MKWDKFFTGKQMAVFAGIGISAYLLISNPVTGFAAEEAAYGDYFTEENIPAEEDQLLYALCDFNNDGTEEFLFHSGGESDGQYFVYTYDEGQVKNIGSCSNFNRYGTYYSQEYNALVIVASGGADWITYEYYQIGEQLELFCTLTHNFFEPGMGTVTEDNPYGYAVFAFKKTDENGITSDITASDWNHYVDELQEIAMTEFNFYDSTVDFRGESGLEATHVEFEREYISDESGYAECAVIKGITATGETAWIVKTEKYPAAQLTQCKEFGVFKDAYYYMEGGNLVKLNLADGSVVWRCACGGSPAADAILFADNGNIYYSGYYGPAFVAIDSEGNVLKIIETLDVPYYWPYKLEAIDSERIAICFEGSDSGEGGMVYMNLEDYSYYEP